MKAISWLPIGASLLSGALAADPAWKTITTIEPKGQHFFYANNGSQFLMKGVAYQQDFEANGTSNNDPNKKYTDPLADGSICARDIPILKQIYTNIIRVYAIDPTVNHDDCMQQLAANDIYVIADLSQPSESILSDSPAWNVPLFRRYASVIDALSKYNNVVGFFAGNEVVQRDNQTASAAFVKAAVRDSKAYIKARNYRTSLGVGYATADVPSRDQLAAYFACEPVADSSTSIDFWGYNVYSWCGFSSYAESSYGERVNFFQNYPVPVFFAEYGCNQNIQGGEYQRPFTEVGPLYGNMTEVFSGGIVYQYFDSANKFGLVKIDSNNKVVPYPDYTSLQSQLATISPTLIQSNSYTATNKAPACPTNDKNWVPKSSPLPQRVNPDLCDCEAKAFTCGVTSDDATKYKDSFDFICSKNSGKYCVGIDHNATTGSYGAISGCDAKVQLGFVANQYYLDAKDKASACNFNGLAATQAASTGGSCTALLNAAGTDGAGTVPSATGQIGQTSAASSSKSVGAPALNSPGYFAVGKALFAAYLVALVVSGVGMIVL